MTKKVRLGILGVAKINQRVFPSFSNMKHTVLAGIASRSLHRAKAAAKEAGIPSAYGSYEEMLKDPAIDAIYNPLPNHLHAEWTMKAADHGKHVLCEKPLAPTAKQASEIVRHCLLRGVKLMDGFMWPHHPRSARVKTLLKTAQIGELLRAQGSFTFHMDNLESSNIRLDPEKGGGSLLDVGCYPVYGIRWAFEQEPVKVLAMARFHRGVDVEMNGTLWFADGRMASFDCGFTMPVRMGLQLTGSQGVLEIPRMWLPEPNASYQIHREGGTEIHFLPGHDQIALMHDHFSQCILEDKFPEPGPMEGVKTLRVLDALLQSAREGKEIRLSQA